MQGIASWRIEVIIRACLSGMAAVQQTLATMAHADGSTVGIRRLHADY